MKTKTVIDFTVENLFSRTSEQLIVKALFYSEGLNMSLRKAQEALGFDEIGSVNKSIKALNGYRLNKQGFNDTFLKAEKIVYSYIQYKRSKNKKREFRAIANRFSFKHDILISKQQLLTY